MSIETWKREFYPIEATEAAKLDAVACTAHSLKKWEGLLKRNTDKHKVTRVDGTLSENHNDYASDGDFSATGNNCSLCKKYGGTNRPEGGDYCSGCPIYKVTGEDCIEEYEHTVEYGHAPFRMINLLRKTLKAVEANPDGF